jgi:hypothetical protein
MANIFQVTEITHILINYYKQHENFLILGTEDERQWHIHHHTTIITIPIPTAIAITIAITITIISSSSPNELNKFLV